MIRRRSTPYLITPSAIARFEKLKLANDPYFCQLGSVFVGCIHHPDVRKVSWGEGLTNWPESLHEQAQVWQHGHQVSERGPLGKTQSWNRDLWNALGSAIKGKVDVAAMMDTWTQQMGFPIITLERDNSSSKYEPSAERERKPSKYSRHKRMASARWSSLKLNLLPG